MTRKRHNTQLGYNYGDSAVEVVRALRDAQTDTWARLAQEAVETLVEVKVPTREPSILDMILDSIAQEDGAVPVAVLSDVNTDVTTVDPWHDVTEVDWRDVEDTGECFDGTHPNPNGGY